MNNTGDRDMHPPALRRSRSLRLNARLWMGWSIRVGDMIRRAVGLRGGELLDPNSCDRWCRRIMPLEMSAFGRSVMVQVYPSESRDSVVEELPL